LPFYYDPLEAQVTDKHQYPLAAVTQRPMAMYHSWDSQNAWLRQIHTHNYLYVNAQTAQRQGIDDGDWIWVESQWGKVKCMARHSEAVEPGTVWTWNAIGKAAGAWNLTPDANESQKGFPAQPPDLGGTAIGRGTDFQFRSDHRPGRVVRRAGEDL
jgi:anaerobic selenocysteine-containing dehydrogenase